MTPELRDFLNWFDGFSANVKGAPNRKQWKIIRERIKKIVVPAGPIPLAVIPPPKPASAAEIGGVAMDAGPGFSSKKK